MVSPTRDDARTATDAGCRQAGLAAITRNATGVTTAEAAEILRCLRRSMTPGAPLLILGGVIGPPNQDPLLKFLDLMMLASAGGRERTEPEWAGLLTGSGFQLVRTTQATPNLHVIEALPDQA
jgi:O-methyltransferase domain